MVDCFIFGVSALPQSFWHPCFFKCVEQQLRVRELLEHWPFAGAVDRKVWHQLQQAPHRMSSLINATSYGKGCGEHYIGSVPIWSSYYVIRSRGDSIFVSAGNEISASQTH